jgi:tRNA modification GTPase
MTGPQYISFDTIFALATAPGRAGIAVLRLSGPAAVEAAEALTGSAPDRPREAIRCRMVDPESGEALDDGLLLWFPAPRSFTGEDVVELHIHGGRATVEAVAGALAARPGLRPADPGEFSRRAFLAGKLDLTAVEAIADLVDAETDAQRRQALRQLDGGLVARLDGWRTDLIGLMAHLEADIDFPDEDLPDGVSDAARGRLAALEAEMRVFLDDARRGERLRSGFRIALLGAPNAGKSSLLNAIAARDAAIVSETAGTTRDVIEVHLDLGGWPVTLADTAGLRETGDEIEREGVRRALDRAADADLRLAVFAADRPTDTASLDQVARGALAVVNKIDLAAAPDEIGGATPIAVSARTGAGMADLLRRIQDAAAEALDGTDAPLTRTRHRSALLECADALARARGVSEPELAAEDVRLAARALGRITGRMDVEDLLDVIFRDFCIGK